MSFSNVLKLTVFLNAASLLVSCTQVRPPEPPTPPVVTVPKTVLETVVEVAVEVVSETVTEKTNLPSDPALHTGVLANGMRYILLKNQTPEQTAGLRLLIRAGALHEADDQNGLAHFVEHMAFNGSKNVPEGEMTRLLERQGLAFGADTNASTFYDYTLYMLDLPRVDEETLDTALFIMRETAGNLTFNPDAIERERGVVAAEKRQRQTPFFKSTEALMTNAFPDAAFRNRNVIGTDEVLANAPRERFVDFYDRYYRPDNAVLLIVGDVAPEEIEEKVSDLFSDWVAKPVTPRTVDFGTVNPATSLKAHYFYDSEAVSQISIISSKPARLGPETLETRQADLMRDIANTIVTRRLSAIALEKDTPLQGPGLGSQSFAKIADAALAQTRMQPERWQEALSIIEQELRRAFLHGFTEAEISEQVANYRTALKTAAEQAAARPSQVLATQLALSVNAGITLTSPEQNYQLFEDNISAITPEALLAAFRLEWGQSAPSIHVSNNIPLDDPEATILAAYNKSQQIAVAPPTDDVVKAFAYTDFGKPGQVAETGKLGEFDTQTIRFANNVRLNIKKTDTEKGSIHAAVHIGAGLMEFPSDVDGLQGISGFLVAGGLEEHNVNEILTLVAGHNVQPTLTIGDRSLNGIAKTTPEDLLFQLQLWTAYITSPGYRPEGEAQWKQQVGQFEQFIRTEPSGVLYKEYPRMVRNGDMRFGRGEGEELAKRTFAEFDEVYKQNLMTGAIEVTLVGDVDPEFAIEAVAKTFGALPERRAEHLIKQGKQTLTFPEDRSLRTMTHFGDVSRAYSIVTWPTSDASDPELEASLAILSRVMQSKVIDELREELGAAYNPAVGSDMSQTFKGFGTFVARAEVETPNVDSVLTIIEDIGRSFAADGAISEDQLLRARKPLLEELEEQESTNAYWADQLGHAQLIPEDISRLKKLKVAYQSVSLVDLQKVAKTYLLESAPLKIRVIPENKAP